VTVSSRDRRVCAEVAARLDELASADAGRHQQALASWHAKALQNLSVASTRLDERAEVVERIEALLAVADDDDRPEIALRLAEAHWNAALMEPDRAGRRRRVDRLRALRARDERFATDATWEALVDIRMLDSVVIRVLAAGWGLGVALFRRLFGSRAAN